MKKKDYTKIIIFILSFSFFIFFSCYDKSIICDDSPGYISMDSFREPLYPLFIMLIRLVFANSCNNYLDIVAIIQGLLMFYATYSLVIYLRKEYKTSNLISYLMLFIILSISLLCRFAAKRSSMYSNSILSEGIAYPLFLIFIKHLISYLLSSNTKSLVFSSLTSFLLISIRKQMYLSLILIALSIIYVAIANKKIKSGIICLLLTCLFVFGGTKMFDLAYMNITKGVNTVHTGDNRFLTTMIFYVSEKDDAEYIANKEAKQLFLDIYDACNEKEYLSNSVDGDWYDKALHFSDSYDYIQIDTMLKVEQEYVKNNYALSETEQSIKVDEINNKINTSLLSVTLFRILKQFVCNVLMGLMINVSAERSIFKIYALVIYVAYLALLIYLFVKEGISKYTILGSLTILSVIINVCLVSLIIFCQTRYTIYNMALFYISGLIMLCRAFFYKKSIIEI